jgi:hypothetical protein
MARTRKRKPANTTIMELWRDSAQSIANATITDVVWEAGASASDNAERIWTPSAPTLLTFHVPGIYSVAAHADWAANNTGFRYLAIVKANYDGNIANGVARQQAVQGDETQMGVAVHLKVNTPGQAIKVQVFQTSGGALNMLSQFDSTHFTPSIMVARIGSPYIQDTY